jgi:hypothetical protein
MPEPAEIIAPAALSTTPPLAKYTAVFSARMDP